MIHWLVGALLTHTLKPLTSLRARWTEERGQPWTDREWEHVLASSTYIPRSSKLKLIQMYIIHRAYLSPDKINKNFNINTSTCPRCQLNDADLLHMLRSCTSLQTYWCAVTETLTKCTKTQTPNTWEICILGIYTRTKKNRVISRFRDLGLITAKRLVTRRWKHKDPPTVASWMKSLEVWAQAESSILHREEMAGLRKYAIAQSWDAILNTLTHPDAVEQTTPSQQAGDKSDINAQ